MLYIGPNQSRTPAHMDLCGSVGHNIIVHAMGDAHALWHFVHRDDLHIASRYWSDTSNTLYPLERDHHYMENKDLVDAPFNVYECRQELGDLIIIPSNCIHQVLNVSSNPMDFAIKFAWNVVTVDSLVHYYNTTLPSSYRSAHQDTYRGIHIIYNTIQRWADVILAGNGDGIDLKELSTLLELTYCILASDTYEGEPQQIVTVDEPATWCLFCKQAIFNRRMQCETCTFASFTQHLTAFVYEADNKISICVRCHCRGYNCSDTKRPHELTLVQSRKHTHLQAEWERAWTAYERLCAQRDAVVVLSFDPAFVDKCKSPLTVMQDIHKQRASHPQ